MNNEHSRTTSATRRGSPLPIAVVLTLLAGTTLPLLAQNGLPPQRPGQQRPGVGAAGLQQPVEAVQPTTPATEGSVTLDFPNQSVEITAFAEYVGQTLELNIIIKDEGLANQRIVFQAPIEIPKTDLLKLLSSLVEDRGYALTRDELGFYVIEQVMNVDPNFDADEFSTTRVFRTPLVKPSVIQGPITQALREGTTARFTPFDDMGILMVTGSPKTMDTIKLVIDKILEEIDKIELTRFELTNVAAEFAMARILVLNGQIGAGATGGTGVPTQPGQQGAAARVSGGSLINLDTRLIIDQGNALIFRGSPEEAIRVRVFIEMVDRVIPLKVRRYVIGAAASDVADVAQQLGLGTVRAVGGGGGGGSGGSFGTRGGGQAGGEGNLVTGSSMTVDAELGAITYFGTPAQHEILKTIVDDFTLEQTETEIVIKMYQLENAEADSVIAVLDELIADPTARGQIGGSPFLPGSRQTPVFSGQLGGLQPPLGGGDGLEASDSGFNIRQDNVIIVSDEDRNQIIIKATPREQRQLARVIRDLDRRQPQVYIEARIVSINTSNSFNWAIETQINAGQFLLFTNLGLASPTTGSDGQPTTNRIVPNGSNGITSALVRNDYVPFIVNALTSRVNGRLQSTPRILVRDNESATVSSQSEQPFSTTSQGNATTVTGQGGTASAGTTLTVEPRISSGGYLTLEYTIELSSFQGSSSTPGLQPPTQSDSYQSIVQVPTDSTIVIGGFTLEDVSKTESGIPILMDIPLIGNLFKSLTTTSKETTIFVFITPTIMTDENFLDLRLATEGPMKDAGIEGNIPELEAAVIPIHEESLMLDRAVPEDQTPRLSQAQPSDLGD